MSEALTSSACLKDTKTSGLYLPVDRRNSAYASKTRYWTSKSWSPQAPERKMISARSLKNISQSMPPAKNHSPITPCWVVKNMDFCENSGQQTRSFPESILLDYLAKSVTPCHNSYRSQSRKAFILRCLTVHRKAGRISSWVRRLYTRRAGVCACTNESTVILEKKGLLHK